MLRCLLFAAAVSFSYPAFTQHLVKTIVASSQKDLVPEGIAVDEKTGMIYTGSLWKHTIIQIDTAGRAKDFVVVNNGRGEHMEILGMKIDRSRNWLWALSSTKDGKWYTEQLHAFDFHEGDRG